MKTPRIIQIHSEFKETREQLKKDLIKRYGGIKEAVEEIQIPRSTLNDFFEGKTKYMSEPTRIKLYEATNFDYLSKPFRKKKKKRKRTSLKPRTKIENKLELQLRNSQTSLQNIRNILLSSNNLSEKEKAEVRESLILNDEQRARRAADLFYAFLTEVANFPENARKKFTNLVSEEDAGYSISLINYLYNPDKFKSWIGKSSYHLRK